MSEKLDQFDQRILEELQKDSGQSQRALSEKVGLSQNACWRRIKLLEEAGIIRNRSLVLDRHKVGAGLVVFVMIKTRHHSEEWLRRFRNHVSSIPDVVDFYRIGGEFDYMLKVVTKDMLTYDAVYHRIINKVDLESVASNFAMECIAEQRPYPIYPD